MAATRSNNEEPVKSRITILIDSAESQPFTFTGLRADANQNHRPIVVPIRRVCLGRHPHSLGDYTAEGLQGFAHVERKSLEDCQSTLLGWDSQNEKEKDLEGRRKRFEKELSNFAQIRWPLVIVEATYGECLAKMPEWGVKPRATNAKIFARTVLAYTMDYRVPWLFCDSRRMAEQQTFRFLMRAARKLREDDQ